MLKVKKIGVLAAATGTGLFATSAMAAPFTAGSLVVFQVGTGGTTALSSAATTDLLDEYTATGTQLQQITLPTTSSGSATSEGQITTGPTGLLAVAGYNLTAGTTGAAASVPSATTAQRVVNVVDSTGTINSSTQLSNAFSGNNIRGAVTDGTNVFASGTAATASVATAGIQTATLGGTTSSGVESALTNTRTVNIFGGNLFFSSSGTGTAGTAGIYEVAGTPTTTGNTPTLIAADAAASPYAFFFASLTGVNAPAGLNTLYVADSTGVLQKYSLNGGTYTLTGSVTVTAPTGGSAAITGVTGLTPAVAGASAGALANLYLTSPTTLYSYADAAGYGVAPTATAPTALVTAATNTAFRGVAFSPTGTFAATAVPEPTTLGLAAAAATGLLARRRRRD